MEDDDDEEGDRLVDVFVLCAGAVGDVVETRPPFANSGRGAGRRVLSDNVLTIYMWLNEMKVSSFSTNK